MNLAFPAALIVLLTLPGAIFRYSYARGALGWASPTSFRTVWDEVAYSAVFAIGLHFFWSLGIGMWGFSIDAPAVLALLTGNQNGYAGASAAVSRYQLEIATYFLSLFLGAAVLGKAGHKVVRGLHLDLQTRMFRFENEWFYLLTGEILCFREVSGRKDPKSIDGVYLSAVVDHSKESYLYRGIVQDWSFSRDGELSSIRLRDAHRRLLSADRDPEEDSTNPATSLPDDRYYEIRGDLFLLRYAEIKTLNLDYFMIEEDEPTARPEGWWARLIGRRRSESPSAAAEAVASPEGLTPGPLG